MINLQLALIYLLKINKTLTSVFANQHFFNLLGLTCSPRKTSESYLANISEPICSYLSTVTSGNTKSF